MTSVTTELNTTIVDTLADNAAACFRKLETIQGQIKIQEDLLNDEIARLRESHRLRYAALYEVEEQLQSDYEQAAEALKAAGLDIWTAAGKPEKGKTFGFGCVQVRVSQKVSHYDEDRALDYCDQNGLGNLTRRIVDKTRFQKAVKERIIEVPVEICEVINDETAVVIQPKLLERAVELQIG